MRNAMKMILMSFAMFVLVACQQSAMSKTTHWEGFKTNEMYNTLIKLIAVEGHAIDYENRDAGVIQFWVRGSDGKLDNLVISTKIIIESLEDGVSVYFTSSYVNGIMLDVFRKPENINDDLIKAVEDYYDVDAEIISASY